MNGAMSGAVLRWLPAATVLLVFAGTVRAESRIGFSDTNFVNFFRNDSGECRVYDYNRLRADLVWRETTGVYTLQSNLDLLSYAGRSFLRSGEYRALKNPDPDLPFNPYLRVGSADDIAAQLYLYRLNARANFESDTITVGLQRIPFGVGRLWNPTDTFNPVDALSFEPEERTGVCAANYTHYVNGFTFLETVVNLKRNSTLDKYGVRAKTHCLHMDLGGSLVKSRDVLMTGVECAANLLDTGVEVRSELGLFRNDLLDSRYVSAVTGFETAVTGKLTVVGEYFYNGLGDADPDRYDPSVLRDGNWNLGRHYMGLQTTYALTPLTGIAVSAIVNMTDDSLVLSPGVTYSLNNETTAGIGANVFSGGARSEFGADYHNRYFVKIETYF